MAELPGADIYAVNSRQKYFLSGIELCGLAAQPCSPGPSGQGQRAAVEEQAAAAAALVTQGLVARRASSIHKQRMKRVSKH